MQLAATTASASLKGELRKPSSEKAKKWVRQTHTDTSKHSDLAAVCVILKEATLPHWIHWLSRLKPSRVFDVLVSSTVMCIHFASSAEIRDEKQCT
eukprot:1162107-Pelagomonas_calceolata.AAC.3